jgi:hypothetical protein
MTKGLRMSDYGSTPPAPPPYGAARAQGYPPPNYLVWAILSTVLCCLPLGIASIVFSTQVNSKWSVGDVSGAHDASGKAKRFALWGTIAGVVINVGVAIAVAAFGGMGAHLDTGSGY